MQQILGVIPARFGASRFPGKPLKEVAGRPLLQWVLEGASQSQKINKIIVATDHSDIVSLVESLGFEAIMTDSDLPSGSDRVWQATKDRAADVIVNIQGDEPLITGGLLDSLVSAFEGEGDNLQMATLGKEFNSQEDLFSENTAKIILNHKSEALYFSRMPLPYTRIDAPQTGPFASVKHIGLYAYRKSFLQKFCQQKPVDVELSEGLEQLRALYLGAKIKVVMTDQETWGVDTPEDVLRIENELKRLGRI